MNIVLLGGTGFLGRSITIEAVAQGHAVTCLARGNGEVAAGATFVQADRDSEDGLAEVSTTHWDAIIDLTSHPLYARRAARDLTANHWVYISSSSVYLQTDIPDRDESAVVVAPLVGDLMNDMTEYAAAKSACEVVYRDATKSSSIIRAGLIGGYGDVTGRSGYYPWRFAHPTGDDVLVPDLGFPIALIDARDLAAWIIECAHQRYNGTFNAAGTTTDLSEVIAGSQELSQGSVVAREVSNEALDAFGVAPWMGPKSLPLWVNDPNFRYVGTLDSTSAIERGLTLRPLRETLSAALEYEEQRQEPRLAGLTDEEEMSLRQTL